MRSSRVGIALAAETPPLVVVSGKTIVAFFPPVTDAELQKNPDANKTLGDFQTYASRVREPLKRAGITFHELYVHSFRVRVGKSVTSFRPAKVDVGYYFITPGKEPRIEYGVMTDTDLLQVAADYFGQEKKISAHTSCEGNPKVVSACPPVKIPVSSIRAGSANRR